MPHGGKTSRGDIEMKVTEVRMKLIKSDPKLKAFADLTFEKVFVVHGVKLIEGQNGLFVAMPSRKMADGEFKDLAHPIVGDIRKHITDMVIAKYNEEIAKGDSVEELN